METLNTHLFLKFSEHSGEVVVFFIIESIANRSGVGYVVALKGNIKILTQSDTQMYEIICGNFCKV